MAISPSESMAIRVMANTPCSLAYAIEDQQRMREAKNYFAWQARLVTPELGRRVVEVGCGVGNFTEFLLDREAVLAVDMDAGCIERIRERYAGRANLRVSVCDAGNDEFSGLATFQADSCVCLNVLEHIHDDRKALSNMASMLVPGGVIVLLVPAFAGLCGPIDKKLGHYRRYSGRSLRELGAATGLRVKASYYMNSVGFFGWWANARVFRREAQSEAQIKIFDNIVVPFLSALESLARPPFGQSLFAVLQKP